MTYPIHTQATAFIGSRLLAAGPLTQVALAVKAAGDTPQTLLVFNDDTGTVIDLDLRGTEQDIVNRLVPHTDAPSPPGEPEEAVGEPRGRGRPRLGVVAREVTLLPRHWEWLNGQKGGASVALRKLVEDAKRATAERDLQRQAQEAAYRVMSALAGNLAGFEEASRALFAGDAVRFASLVSAWPDDIAQYVQRMWASSPGRA